MPPGFLDGSGQSASGAAVPPVASNMDPVVVQMMRQQMLLTQLYALQAVAQEMVAVGKVVGRVMRTIGKG